MEIRHNRTGLLEGINRLLRKSDFRLLEILYLLLKYIHGEGE